MTATVLSFTPRVREAALDVRSHREKVRQGGHEWATGLSNAVTRMVALAREPEDRRQSNIVTVVITVPKGEKA